MSIEWPDNNECAPFEKIAEPIVEALADAIGNGMVSTVGVKRRAAWGSAFGFRSSTSLIHTIDYNGYNIGKSERATCTQPHDLLTVKNLRREWSDQGRTPAEILVTLAVQLGIEQGRRIAAREAEATGPAFKLKLIKSLLDD